jgi:hypothetical protein
MVRPGVKEQTSMERRGVGYEVVPSMVHKRSGEWEVVKGQVEEDG